MGMSTLGLCLAPTPIFFGSGSLYFFPNTRTANTANTRPHLVCVWLQLQFSLALGLLISSRTHERRTRRTHVHTWFVFGSTSNFLWLWVSLFLPEHTNSEHDKHTSTLGLCLATTPIFFGSGSLCFFPNTRTANTANTRPHLVFVWLWVFLFLPEHTNGEHGEHTSTLGLCLAPTPIFFGSGSLYFFPNTRTANARPHFVCVWL